ncbi:unnamed protein product [Vitrella brassicaformis CCMP3155]|uniref:Right handed beta helix domain-containing protein n=1 Tax=Vitrella brassicaformis (strain CCMP3155) TaxID=1169540 RepID=A0A0G4GKJ5_VITBC|nr:unnamed protein product [Vitrella brassicaformis CCMP3155]|eukprot:CEM30544.1 unnamed protein product [Vitrella brassicaformis CCMP3155]
MASSLASLVAVLVSLLSASTGVHGVCERSSAPGKIVEGNMELIGDGGTLNGDIWRKHLELSGCLIIQDWVGSITVEDSKMKGLEVKNLQGKLRIVHNEVEDDIILEDISRFVVLARNVAGNLISVHRTSRGVDANRNKSPFAEFKHIQGELEIEEDTHTDSVCEHGSDSTMRVDDVNNLVIANNKGGVEMEGNTACNVKIANNQPHVVLERNLITNMLKCEGNTDCNGQPLELPLGVNFCKSCAAPNLGYGQCEGVLVKVPDDVCLQQGGGHPGKDEPDEPDEPEDEQEAPAAPAFTPPPDKEEDEEESQPDEDETGEIRFGP